MQPLVKTWVKQLLVQILVVIAITQMGTLRIEILGEVLSCEASTANLPPVGIRLNASKSESMLAKQ